jgi:hypothetical protein
MNLCINIRTYKPKYNNTYHYETYHYMLYGSFIGLPYYNRILTSTGQIKYHNKFLLTGGTTNTNVEALMSLL